MDSAIALRLGGKPDGHVCAEAPVRLHHTIMRVVKPGRDNIFVHFHHCNSSLRTDPARLPGPEGRDVNTFLIFDYHWNYARYWPWCGPLKVMMWLVTLEERPQ